MGLDIKYTTVNVAGMEIQIPDLVATVTGFVSGITEMIKSSVTNAVAAAGKTLENGISVVVEGGKTAIKSAAGGLLTVTSTVKEAVVEVIDDGLDWVEENVPVVGSIVGFFRGH